ncbi:hypothetical protein CCACVL1_21783 [Corchorus capsularis]|uniref:Uncharacterized protein n=1 Tax=Corchorus capsularis TaxID=210143 RepID=A0A1R3H227_COCAP|nr:hypothetical protein CCACVL1_21783 [Corchorus capsularis]
MADKIHASPHIELTVEEDKQMMPPKGVERYGTG